MHSERTAISQNSVQSHPSNFILPVESIQYGNDNSIQWVPVYHRPDVSLSSPEDRADSPRRLRTGVTIEDLPNEALTHVLSYLPPASLTSTSQVSRRFHNLVTAPHAWRIAFSRYFPGASTLDHVPDRGVVDRRVFARLTALASWRNEYITRTRLLKSLSRGRPVRLSTGKHLAAVVTYQTQLFYPVDCLDVTFGASTDNKFPRAIHGAAEQGMASASDPMAAKTSAWGLTDHRIFHHFFELFPGEAEYGLGPGNLVGLPNVMDVSQQYGMIYGEGCPLGRCYYLASGEKRGRFLTSSDIPSEPQYGIPLVNLIMTAVSAVWIAKSPNVPRMTHGLIGILCGFSSGILAAYALDSRLTRDWQWEPGQVTSTWVLSPGVPIVAIVVDENYSAERHARRRVWAIALNALGEVFYLSGIPAPPPKPTSKLYPQQLERLAWKTARSVRWELIEVTRRVPRSNPLKGEPIGGDDNPRSSSDAMDLDERQLVEETKAIENFFTFKPSHFQKLYEGWDMRKKLLVDFAGDDRNGAGESVVVMSCGFEEGQPAWIRRFTRHMVSSVFEWWVSDFVFNERKSIQVTSSALDLSTYTLLTIAEDSLLNTPGASVTLSLSSPPSPRTSSHLWPAEVPGQRARYMAIGTAQGSLYVWDVRAPTSRSRELINLISPLRVIQTDSPEISCVALTSLYLVHGGNDGLVQAWDPLASSAAPIRTLNARFSIRARRRLIQAQASMDGVGHNYYAAGVICLDPDPTVLRGIVSLGTHLRYWSYSSAAADEYKGGKRRRRSQRSGNSSSEWQRFSSSGRCALRDYIADERQELEGQKIAEQKEKEHLSWRFGTDLLGPGASEAEMIAYARMLSEESYTSDELKRREGNSPTTGPSSEPMVTGLYSSFLSHELSSSSSPTLDMMDEDFSPDVAEAIRLSLKDETVEPFDISPTDLISSSANAPPTHCRRSSRAESGSQRERDDLQLALRPSLIDAQNAGVPIPINQDFPVLASSSMNKKGKERYI